MPNPRISSFPPELVAAIFEALVEVSFDSRVFHASRQSAFRDLMSVSQVDSFFREVSLTSPQLWTMLPSLDAPTPAILRLVVERSHPLPFCLSFVDEGSSTSLLISQCEPLAIHMYRLRSFCLEVSERALDEATYINLFLAFFIPRVEHCMVTFRGLKNVPLFDTADHRNISAPHLRTLHLTNCYVVPESNLFSQLSRFAIQNFSRPHATPSWILLDDIHLWTSQLTLLRHLVLWNCFSDISEDSCQDHLHLPLLESLTVAAPFVIASRVATRLEYPSQCFRSVTVLFPDMILAEHAPIAVAAAAGFLLFDEDDFRECQVTFDERLPSLRCRRATTTGNVILQFPVLGCQVHVDVVPQMTSSLSTPYPPSACMTPTAIFAILVWECMSKMILTRLCKAVTDLEVISPHNPFGPIIFPSVLPSMPNVQAVTFTSSAIFTPHSLSRRISFTKLQKVIVRLADRSWTEDLKGGLSRFLMYQADVGNPVQTVLFVISPGLCLSFGHAMIEGIRVMLAELVDSIPAATAIEWVEG